VETPDILLEDDALVALDKPAGMAAAECGRLLPAPVRPGAALALVHRVDAEASGAALFARDREALGYVSGQFQSKTAETVLIALCVVDPASPPPPEFSVELAMGEDRAAPGRMRAFGRRGGEPAATRFRVLESFGRYAWIECRPLSGRRHQVRVHLAAQKAPVLGDALYGDPQSVLLLSSLKRRYKGRDEERPLVRRLALHLALLRFNHPRSRLPAEVASPVPADLGLALKYLRKFGGGL
jgi:23S rRNA-/tRNA-specific pseudouridylate synthase